MKSNQQNINTNFSVVLSNKQRVDVSTLCCPVCGERMEVINYTFNGSQEDQIQTITRCNRLSGGRMLTDEELMVTSYVNNILELECSTKCLTMTLNIDEVSGYNTYNERY